MSAPEDKYMAYLNANPSAVRNGFNVLQARDRETRLAAAFKAACFYFKRYGVTPERVGYITSDLCLLNKIPSIRHEPVPDAEIARAVANAAHLAGQDGR
ncbi:hypothetical protein [Caballeronia sp. M23-90]